MIVTCSFCSTRLQFEDDKAPQGVFTVRCPKCRNLVKAERPVVSGGPDIASKQKPSSITKFENKPKSAPAYQAPLSHNQIIDSAPAVQASAGMGEGSQLLQALAALLQQGTMPGKTNTANASYDWERQRALVCIEAPLREMAARMLSERNYQVYVAEDKTQAVERMREEKMNMIVLSPLFEEQNYGETAVRQEMDFLRPADRRRMFVVLITDAEKTMDSHAAFLENVNLVVNPKDINAMPRALDISMRQYNELYHNFNSALGVGPIG